MLNNNSIHSLISVANINSGLLDKNFVSSPDEFKKFNDKIKGIPILIPADENIFEFKDNDIFEIQKNQILSTIYEHQNDTYVGFKHSFYSFKFLSKFKIKKKYKKILDKYTNQNLNLLKNIEILKNKFDSIGAFQTRNIPHFGHELIIKKTLESCDHLVINPVIGPKKKGDVSISCLNFVFNDLIKRKYKYKISFEPILANMYYAGPREAVHHSIIRKNLGFDLFTVGRDHAGAENIYNPNSAPKLVKNLKSRIGININTHFGAKFCKKCNKIILIGDCNHNHCHFLDISGTDFRNSLRNREIFALADKEMQIKLFETNLEFFEK